MGVVSPVGGKFMRRRAGIISLFVPALSAALILMLTLKAEARSLVVTYAAISGSHAALWASKEAGFFDKHGVPVELIYLGGGQATKVLLAGTSPIISISGPGADYGRGERRRCRAGVMRAEYVCFLNYVAAGNRKARRATGKAGRSKPLWRGDRF